MRFEVFETRLPERRADSFREALEKILERERNVLTPCGRYLVHDTETSATYMVTPAQAREMVASGDSYEPRTLRAISGGRPQATYDPLMLRVIR